MIIVCTTDGDENAGNFIEIGKDTNIDVSTNADKTTDSNACIDASSSILYSITMQQHAIRCTIFPIKIYHKLICPIIE